MKAICFGRLNVSAAGTPVNLGVSTLASNAAYSDPTMSVASVAGFCLDMLPFKMDIDPGLDTYEKVLVTAISSTTFTMSRGIDGTTPRSHTAGAVVAAKFAVAGWYTSVVAGLTGKMYFGTRNLLVSGLVGVIKEYYPNASGPYDDVFQFMSNSQDGNPLSLSEFSIDAAVSGEGLYVTMWQR